VDSLPNSVDGIDLTDKLFNGGENELRSLLVNINPLCEDYIEERLEHGEDADPQTALRYQAEGVDVKITIDCMLEDGTKIGNISFWNMAGRNPSNQTESMDLLLDETWLSENTDVIEAVYNLLNEWLSQSIPPMAKVYPWQENSSCEGCVEGCPVTVNAVTLDQEEKSGDVTYYVLEPWYEVNRATGEHLLLADLCSTGSHTIFLSEEAVTWIVVCSVPVALFLGYKFYNYFKLTRGWQQLA